MTEIAEVYYEGCRLLKKREAVAKKQTKATLTRRVRKAADKLEALGAKQQAETLRRRLAGGPAVLFTESELIARKRAETHDLPELNAFFS